MRTGWDLCYFHTWILTTSGHNQYLYLAISLLGTESCHFSLKQRWFICLLIKLSVLRYGVDSYMISAVCYMLYYLGALTPMFEPVTGPLSIVYTNGEEWEDRRKWLYKSLKGTSLESYIPIFIKVCNCVEIFCYLYLTFAYKYLV